MKKNILVTCRMGPGTLEAKLIPLSKVSVINKIFVLRKSEGIPIPKVEYITLPLICKYSLINIIIAPLLLTFYTIRNKIDFIIAYHFIPHALFAYISSTFTKTPYIFCQTGSLCQKYCDNKILCYFIIKILGNADYINVPGNQSKYFWIKKGLSEKKINVLHSTIDTKLFKNNPCVEKKYDFIILSRLDPEKQIHILIRMFYQLKNQSFNFNVIIVGDGVERKKLEELTRKYQLNKIISFVGFKENVQHYFNQSKIYLMYSSSEGLPTSLMQAMSCELIAFSTRVGNISDILEYGKTGFIFESNEYDQYLTKLKKVYLDYYTFNELRANARKEVKKNHSYAIAEKRWSKLLEKY